jgi:RNA polymerase sigma-70 factor (ECF subfamily)
MDDFGRIGEGGERIQQVLLLKTIAQGDELALAKLYDATCTQVYGLSLRILGDRQMAEEVTMDVYLQVWQQAGNYSETRGSTLAWLMMLTRSRAIDRLRTLQRERRYCTVAPAEEYLDIEPLLDIQAMQTERSNSVNTAFQKLRTVERQVLHLAYFAGMSHAEIANHVSLPLGTVKTHIRNALSQLRELLDKEKKL